MKEFAEIPGLNLQPVMNRFRADWPPTGDIQFNILIIKD
jgi:hypothetical protein